MIIKTWRDPYEIGVNITTARQVEINPGITVIVGCNGAGKKTLLEKIKDVCGEQKIPCFMHDNLRDGGHNSISELFFNNQYEDMSYLMCASEGEAIKSNVYHRDYKTFLEKGISKKRNIFAGIFGDEEEKLPEKTERVLLFDAVDSGLSVDAVIELKQMFNAILEAYKDTYIVIAANEYELARNASCLDVTNGKPITFKDYEDYRNFIIKSREKKEKRINRQIAYAEKQREKEYQTYKQYKAEYEQALEKYPDKENLTYSQRLKLESLEYKAKDYLRDECSFLSEKYIKEREESERSK